MGEFNSDDHYIYYWGQESLRRNGVAIMVNKRVWNAVLGCNLKNDRKNSVHFQGKPFSITEIQVYASTNNADEAEVERFYEDLQDLLELTPKKDVLFIIGYWNAKVGSQETPGQIRSDQISRSVVSDSSQPHELQHARPPCPSPTPRVFTQTHVHRVSDAIQPSHPLSSPSPLAPNTSQYQSLFQWVNSSQE